MRTLKTYFPVIVLLAIFGAQGVHAQQTSPKPPPLPTNATPRAAAPAPEAARRRTPPQVYTVVHRLNGIKLMRWLYRSGAPVAALVEFDDENPSQTEMHTSITAGFAMGDGHSIVASLPQAEAEVETPVAVVATPPPGEKRTEPVITPSAQSADLMVMRSDGFQFTANYVGLDGLTGLSLLRIEGLELPSIPDALEEKLSVGQRVRLYAPEPSGSNVPGNLFLRMGEIEGRLMSIVRSSSGRISHLTVRAPNLSPAINGGVALNEAGETVGIVEASSATEARILPAQIVRRAAARVLSRRASVPRPLLGVRGKAVTAASLFQFTSSGWSQAEAVALMGKGQGLLLTSVAPHTPAALADLRPGDIIVRVNNSDVKSVEEFSFMLGEASGEAPVMFTILRGQTPAGPPAPALAPAPPAATPAHIVAKAVRLEPFKLPKPLKPLKPISIPVKMNFSFKMEMTTPKTMTSFAAPTAALIARGVETIPLAAAAASRRGARAGVLVINVVPSSQAARSGLREGDVIESVNGKLLSSPFQISPHLLRDASLALELVRNGQKLTINLPARETKAK
ncbi:MAG: PDZ domain-containing protein [Acidobacteria bacterium]|nr:PDZ domain-containing protein [Acidobacteriota bacterium]